MLVRFYNDEDRRAMYLYGEGVEGDRLDAALDELRPLPALNKESGSDDDSDAERIRAIVREELETQRG